MDSRAAYLLGVAAAFGAMFVVWGLFHAVSPWLTARYAGVPVSLLKIIGMRLRKTDPVAVVGAMVVLRKLGEEVSPLELEAAYLAAPEDRKNIGALIRAVRPALAGRLETRPAGDAA
jgi:uncharacterized protein YqfA (UPF0365 family)